MLELSLQEFADKLNEIMPVIVKEFLKKQSDELGKVTMPQFFILDFLNRHGESRMTDLSNFMGVTTAAMTGIVARLVKNKYVQRIYEPQDRRIIKVRPSEKGVELVKKINQQKRKIIINTFGKISQKEREDYLRILMRIHDILTKGKKG